MLNVTSTDQQPQEPVNIVSWYSFSEKESHHRFGDKILRSAVKLPHEVPTVLEGLAVPALKHGSEDVGHQGLSLKKPSEGTLVMIEFYRSRSIPGYRRDHTQLQQMGSPPREVRREPRVVGGRWTTSEAPLNQGAGSLF